MTLQAGVERVVVLGDGDRRAPRGEAGIPVGARGQGERCANSQIGHLGQVGFRARVRQIDMGAQQQSFEGRRHLAPGRRGDVPARPFVAEQRQVDRQRGGARLGRGGVGQRARAAHPIGGRRGYPRQQGRQSRPRLHAVPGQERDQRLARRPRRRLHAAEERLVAGS